MEAELVTLPSSGVSKSAVLAGSSEVGFRVPAAIAVAASASLRGMVFDPEVRRCESC